MENNILNKLTIPNGMEIDINEGWKKLISRQFGGEPGRPFIELIQNFIDSYSDKIPWEERRGDIETSENSISITDYGEGMSYEKLELLTTLGGTDKDNNPSKIGKFGIGFFSIFSPNLHTRKVVVVTKCEGNAIRLIFDIKHPDKLPVITTEILNHEITFSTKVTVLFDNNYPVQCCLDSAIRNLKYYPCRIFINGVEFKSLWAEARQRNVIEFKRGSCHGIIERNNIYSNVSILCKYFHIMDTNFTCFLTGGYNVSYNLEDFERKATPYLRNIKLLINCNDLRLTISRDSYYLDYYNGVMIKIVCQELLKILTDEIDSADVQLVLANQFIFKDKIRLFLEGKFTGDDFEYKLIQKLAERKIFKVKGSLSHWSLLEMYKKLSDGMPLYFAKNQLNTRWLGGAFKHDFIVLVDECTEYGGAKNFYKKMFMSIFKDSVNLDTIREDTEKINELIRKKLIDKNLLFTKCELVKELEIKDYEKDFLKEIEIILAYPEVLEAISTYFNIKIRKIVPAFFTINQNSLSISTGLFNLEGLPVYEETNRNDSSQDLPLVNKDTILLGLCFNNPLIRYLAASEDEHCAYYTLSFIAHELLVCQKQLVPYWNFVSYAREKLTSLLRKALINEIIARDAVKLNSN